jgi:hypothetical protein
MFLKTLEHAGLTWEVDLRVVPSDEGTAGYLEFSFARRSGDEEVCLAWHVSDESLEAIAEKGIDVSEDLLRRQLDLALAEARTVDPRAHL